MDSNQVDVFIFVTLGSEGKIEVLFKFLEGFFNNTILAFDFFSVRT